MPLKVALSSQWVHSPAGRTAVLGVQHIGDLAPILRADRFSVLQLGLEPPAQTRRTEPTEKISQFFMTIYGQMNVLYMVLYIYMVLWSHIWSHKSHIWNIVNRLVRNIVSRLVTSGWKENNWTSPAQTIFILPTHKGRGGWRHLHQFNGPENNQIASLSTVTPNRNTAAI